MVFSASKRQLLPLLLLIAGASSPRAYAQWLVPHIEVRSTQNTQSILPQQNALETHLYQVLRAYAPPVAAPKLRQPIPLQLTLLVEEIQGDRYVATLELRLLRPIYGQIERSPIMSVSVPEVTFEWYPGQPTPDDAQGVPQPPLLRLLYYYITIGVALYYDSFGPDGGAPFYTFLQRNASQFYSLKRGSISRSIEPSELLPQLESIAVRRFREGYTLYHRHVLDAQASGQPLDKALEEALVLWRSIREGDPQHPLLQLLRQTKGREISALIAQHPTPLQRLLPLWEGLM